MEFYQLPVNYKEMRLSPYRKDFGWSYSFGMFPTVELTDQFPSAVFRIAVSSKLSAANMDILAERAGKLNVPLVVDDKTVERLSPKENCFAVGVFRKFRQTLDPVKDHIVLVNPSDRGNAGTIIRTLTAFGFKDLAVIRPSADILDPHTVRASMGSVFRIRHEYFDSFEDYAAKNAGNGGRVFYPFMLNGESMEALRPDRSGPCSLIFGNESSGLPDSFLSLGKPLKIVHENTVDSLNLTIAAGIAMHWFVN